MSYTYDKRAAVRDQRIEDAAEAMEFGEPCALTRDEIEAAVWLAINEADSERYATARDWVNANPGDVATALRAAARWETLVELPEPYAFDPSGPPDDYRIR